MLCFFIDYILSSYVHEKKNQQLFFYLNELYTTIGMFVSSCNKLHDIKFNE